MSSSSTGFTEGRQDRRGQKGPLNMAYVPTEEEKRVLRECNQESFWFRSVPLSVITMTVTQALLSRGTLSASSKAGSMLKVAIAGFCGYLGGKISYMKTCQEKFKKLENSPLGETLRQAAGSPQQYSKGDQSEMSDPDSQSFDSMFQSAEAPSQEDYNTESPVQMHKLDDYRAPADSSMEEEEPRRKAILYEDLRLKNRENYEVTLTQKTETLLKTSPEKETKRPKKEVKTIYGDTWEE